MEGVGSSLMAGIDRQVHWHLAQRHFPEHSGNQGRWLTPHHQGLVGHQGLMVGLLVGLWAVPILLQRQREHSTAYIRPSEKPYLPHQPGPDGAGTLSKRSFSQGNNRSRCASSRRNQNGKRHAERSVNATVDGHQRNLGRPRVSSQSKAGNLALANHLTDQISPCRLSHLNQLEMLAP